MEFPQDLLYDLGVWRDNDKAFKLLYEKKDGSSRHIYCSSNWNFIIQDESMIRVYDTENEGDRSLYVTKVLEWEMISTREEESEEEGNMKELYEDSVLIYKSLFDCFKKRRNFILWYHQKPMVKDMWEDGDMVRFIECEWNWTAGPDMNGNGIPDSIIVYDVRENRFEELDFASIKKCVNVQSDNKNNAMSNQEFCVIVDSIYNSVCDWWDRGDYNNSLTMVSHLKRVMKNRINKLGN
jgi:hypothetical protein